MGNAPMCDSYEARLIKLLDASIPGEAQRKFVKRRFFHSLPVPFDSTVVVSACSGFISSKASPTLAS